MKTTQIIFYLRSNQKNTPSPAAPDLTLHRDEKSIIEKLWFGDLPMSSEILTGHDIRTLCFEQWLNGDVINCFLRWIEEDVKERNIRVYDTYFYGNLEQHRSSLEGSNSRESSLSDYDLLIMPIHHRSGTNKDRHWSVVGVFPRQKLICHCDSLGTLSPEIPSVIFSFLNDMSPEKLRLSEWSFVSPTDICLQNNGYDCSIYTCLNALGMARKKFIRINSEVDLLQARYWIATAIKNTKRKRKFSNRNKRSFININPDLLRKKDISRSSANLFYQANTEEEFVEVSGDVIVQGSTKSSELTEKRR